jgi:hypothetical protein
VGRTYKQIKISLESSVVRLKMTDISEVRTALMMEVVRTSATVSLNTINQIN